MSKNHSDIAERLRALAVETFGYDEDTGEYDYEDSPEKYLLMAEAADEIERLSSLAAR